MTMGQDSNCFFWNELERMDNCHLFISQCATSGAAVMVDRVYAELLNAGGVLSGGYWPWESLGPGVGGYESRAHARLLPADDDG